MNIQFISRMLTGMIGLTIAMTAVRGAEAGIAFAGMIKEGGNVRFVLRSKATGNSSGWLAIGQTFEGYAIRSLDAPAQILVVAKDGAEFRLPFVSARVKHAAAEPPAELKQRVLRNLRMLAAAADQFFLERGVTRASYEDLVGPTKYVKEIIPVDGEDYRSLQFAQAKPMEVRTSQGYVISYRP
ncbi:MAG: hypothetical protein Q7S40_10345 [Opitutaceae bacterium]|nr:hypothetical protein [Opitutaceae bacterium]